MDVLVVVSEAAYSLSGWYADTLRGVKKGAAEARLTVNNYLIETWEQLPATALTNINTPVVFLGTTTKWINDAIKRVRHTGLRVLAVGGYFEEQSGVSAIHLDYHAAVYDVMRCIRQSGRSAPVLFGVNPASAVDAEKRDGYEAALTELFPMQAPMICYNNGSLEDAAEDFRNAYASDAAVCTNDLAALCLMKRLECDGGYDPSKIFLVGFGNTLLGELSQYPLTTITLDYYEVGRQTVSLWGHLTKHPSALSLNCSVACRIIPRLTTLWSAPEAEACSGERAAENSIYDNPFYKDAWVIEALNMERLYEQITITDCRVLQGISSGISYERIAESMDISVGTVQYRVKRMLVLAQADNKEDLIERMARCSGSDVITRLVKRLEKHFENK